MAPRLSSSRSVCDRCSKRRVCSSRVPFPLPPYSPFPATRWPSPISPTLSSPSYYLPSCSPPSCSPPSCSPPSCSPPSCSPPSCSPPSCSPPSCSPPSCSPPSCSPSCSLPSCSPPSCSPPSCSPPHGSCSSSLSSLLALSAFFSHSPFSRYPSSLSLPVSSPSRSSSSLPSSDTGVSACRRARDSERPLCGGPQHRESQEVLRAFRENSRQSSVQALLALMATDVHKLSDAQISACMQAVAACYVSSLRRAQGRLRERHLEGCREPEREVAGRGREARKEQRWATDGEALRRHTFWHRCVGKTLKGDLILKSRVRATRARQRGVDASETAWCGRSQSPDDGHLDARRSPMQRNRASINSGSICFVSNGKHWRRQKRWRICSLTVQDRHAPAAARRRTMWEAAWGASTAGSVSSCLQLCLLADILDALNKVNLTLFQPLPLLLSPSPHSSSSLSFSSSVSSSSSSSSVSRSSSSSVASSSLSAAAWPSAVSEFSAGLTPVWMVHRFYFRLLERLEQELQDERHKGERKEQEAREGERKEEEAREGERKEEGKGEEREEEKEEHRVERNGKSTRGMQARENEQEDPKGGWGLRLGTRRERHESCTQFYRLPSTSDGEARETQSGPKRRKDTRSFLRIVQALALRQRQTKAELETLLERREVEGGESSRSEGDEEDRGHAGRSERPGEGHTGEEASKWKATQCHASGNERLQQLYQAHFFFLFFFERLAKAALPSLLHSSSSSVSAPALSSFAAVSASSPARPEPDCSGEERERKATEGQEGREEGPAAAAPSSHAGPARVPPVRVEREGGGGARGDGRDAETDMNECGVDRARDLEVDETEGSSSVSYSFTNQEAVSVLMAFASALRCLKREEKGRESTWLHASQHSGVVSPRTHSSPFSPSPSSSSPFLSLASSSPRIQTSSERLPRSHDVSIPFSSLLVPIPSPFPAAPSSPSSSSPPSPASPPSLSSPFPPCSPSSAPSSASASQWVSAGGGATMEKVGSPHLARRKTFVAVPLHFSEWCSPRKERRSRAQASARSDFDVLPHLNAAVCLLSSQLLPHVKSLSPATALGLYLQLSRSPFDAAAAHRTLETARFLAEIRKCSPLASPPPLSAHPSVSRALLRRLVEQPSGLLRDLPGEVIPSFMLSVAKCMPQLNAACPLSASLFLQDSAISAPPSHSLQPFPLRFQAPASPLDLPASPQSTGGAASPLSRSEGDGETARLAHAIASLLPVLARRLAFEQLQAASGGPPRRGRGSQQLSPPASADALTALADAQAGGEREVRRACLSLFRAALATLWRKTSRRKESGDHGAGGEAATLREQRPPRRTRNEELGDSAMRRPTLIAPFAAVSRQLGVEDVISLSRIAHAALKLGLLETYQASGRHAHVLSNFGASEDEGRNAEGGDSEEREMPRGNAKVVDRHQETDSEEHLTEAEVDQMTQLLAANIRAFSFRQLQYLSPALLCSPAFVFPASTSRPPGGLCPPERSWSEQSCRQEPGVALRFAGLPLSFQCLAEALRRLTVEWDRGTGRASRPSSRDEWGCRQLLTGLLAANLACCSFPFALRASLGSSEAPSEAARNERGGQSANSTDLGAPQNPGLLAFLPLQSLRTARCLVHATARPQRQHTAGTRISALQEDVLRVLVSTLRPQTPEASKGASATSPRDGTPPEPLEATAVPDRSHHLEFERSAVPEGDRRFEFRFEVVEAVVGPYTVDCILTPRNGCDGSATSGRQTSSSR
ncbi:UNVERIFIED_CONTAM: hypothetical protein HHA_267570 [Hammondia hammondi]|eukprot:XP_008887682.1 hypothetical protein HHA_267570 [Hammondia hammondi]